MSFTANIFSNLIVILLEFGGGNPAPLTFCGGAGPGVEDPEGAGDAVYCGVFDPGGGPPEN